uniref:Putative dynein assembly factor 3 axonemal n=1 Tax=Panstrongylus lignarius TaxID=156445 RepID=A0A224XG76_9HEMI
MFWGYSPALDLLKIYKQFNNLEGKLELNILVAGSADARHILKTVSKFYTHEEAQNITINFYIIDLLLELVAREMLLVLIALEPSDKIGLKEKSNLWMEIYGNSFLRPTTAEYLIKKAYQYVKMITDKKYQLRRMPCLDLDNLKYKEKDQLETIFKFWVKNHFNMAVSWDNRLRKFLGIRYDSRMGVFDWDYFMKLKDIKDGEKVNPREYKQWRNTGMAFTWLEKEFSVSNATLAVGIESDGDKLLSLNYLGDIISGPYYCFGLECEDKDMMQEVNNTRAKRATDLTERSLMRMFHEIEHNSKYVHVGTERDLGYVTTEMAKLNFNYNKFSVDCDNIEEDYVPLPIKHKLIFLPINTLEDAAKLEKFHRFFDLMTVGQGLLKRLNANVLSVVKNNGPILMETRKFLLLKKEDLQTFEDQVKDVMKTGDCVRKGAGNFTEDNYVTFQVQFDEPTEEMATI